MVRGRRQRLNEFLGGPGGKRSKGG